MSRFDRRLKPEEFNKRNSQRNSQKNFQRNFQINSQRNVRRSSSPRPGEASCKLRPRTKNNGMLGTTLFMGDENNLNKPSIEVIESASPTVTTNLKSGTTSGITLDNVSTKNNKLIEKLKSITDPNIRIIYNHEIRINTIEATVDCLDDIKCGEVLDNQKKNEDFQVITDLNNRVTANLNSLQKMNDNFKNINKNITEIEGKNEELKDVLKNDLEKLQREIICEIEEKTKNIEPLQNENINLKRKIENIKEILKNILSVSDDNKDDIIYEIENL